MHHPWYTELDCGALRECLLRALYAPEVRGMTYAESKDEVEAEGFNTTLVAQFIDDKFGKAALATANHRPPTSSSS